jgi:pimeloyl-ACP methyl ester carboxylesterase
MEPPIAFSPSTQIAVQAIQNDLAADIATDPSRVGTVSPVVANLLPEVPTEWPLTPNHRSKADMAAGKVFYVPPESYNVGTTANSAEATPIELQVSINTKVQGRIPFILRPPPIILVHGIMSSPQTWEPSIWGEDATSPFKTRIYAASWATTSTKGYSENYRLVAKQIEDALEDYRTGNDHGHNSLVGFHGLKYAAIRADVVAHSQGGQITRFYLANGMPMQFDRSGWSEDHANNRTEDSPTGAWPYLRDSNFGVGSIRRFVTMGSPFKGSPWATLACAIFADGDAGPTPAVPAGSLHNLLMLAIANSMIEAPTLQMFWDSVNSTYLPPTCVADLSVNSSAQTALESAQYPPGLKRIRWFPIVGIATETAGTAPVQSTLMQILITLCPVLPVNPTGFSPLHPAQSDLIVPACSQRNLPPDCGDATNPMHPGEIFTYTSHSATNAVPNSEPESVAIRDRIVQLLSGYPSPYNPSWSLGP